MSENQRYDLARLAAVGCFVVSAMLAVVASNTDLELTKQQVAWVTVIQAGITALAVVLPRVQGDGRQRNRRKD